MLFHVSPRFSFTAKKDKEGSETDVAQVGCIMVGREEEGFSYLLAVDFSWNYVLQRFL